MNRHDSVSGRSPAEPRSSGGPDREPQTGAAAFFLDLAVFDPQDPQRQILGIACDGDSYRAARWARDRDRLRRQVLEDRGWRIHRIWSHDWLHRPEAELERLLATLAAAQPK